MNTPPRGRGHIYGTQDAIARLYSSPAGIRRAQPGNQGNQTGNQLVQHSGPQNLGHQVITSEHTAFRNYQSNTFSGQSSYHPHSAQFDGRPHTSSAQIRPRNQYPQPETSSSNLRYTNPSSNRYGSQTRTSNQPVSLGEGHSGSHQEAGYANYSMPKSMFYNPNVSQNEPQYPDIPSHSRSYNDTQSRNISSGYSTSQNTPYQNTSMMHSYPAGHSTENAGFQETGSIVQPTWQYVGNGSIPSSAPSQGYTPSSYQQKVSSKNYYVHSINVLWCRISLAI